MSRNKVIKDFIFITLVTFLCIIIEILYILLAIKYQDHFNNIIKIIVVVSIIISTSLNIINCFNYIKLIFLLKKLLNIINKY